MTYSVLAGAGVRHYLLFLTFHEVCMKHLRKKNLDPRNKYPREKILDPRKYPREKLLNPIIPTRKNFGPTKISTRKNVDPRNTHKKKLWTYEIPKRKILDIRKTHEKKFWTCEIHTRKNFWIHEGTIARDPRNLLHSWYIYIGLSRENVKSLVNKTINKK